MNRRPALLSSALALLALSSTVVALERPARADASCSALIAGKLDYLTRHGGSFAVEMTMHRENIAAVSYSSGSLWRDSRTGHLIGGSNQLFSDRRSGAQPFNVNAGDRLELDLSPDGLLHIYYATWRFETDWDMSCQGPVVTKYLPGFGVVTLTFRNWEWPIG